MSGKILRTIAAGAASVVLAGGAMLSMAGAAQAAPVPTRTTADHQPGAGHNDPAPGRHQGPGDHRHCTWQRGYWTWTWTWRHHHRVKVRQWVPAHWECDHHYRH